MDHVFHDYGRKQLSDGVDKCDWAVSLGDIVSWLAWLAKYTDGDVPSLGSINLQLQGSPEDL